jgi:ATP-dependent Clp protease ATP-binding subunit ClpB
VVEVDRISSRENSKDKNGIRVSKKVCTLLSSDTQAIHLICCSEQLVDAKKIARLENELKRLREQLLRVEQRGPEVHRGSEDRRDSEAADNVFISLLARSRRTVSSPDIITPESIAAIVEKATKIPVRQLLDTDKERLLHLGRSLATKV